MGGGWQGGGIMKKNYIYSDILKAISICFVILMHSLQYKANADYQKIYREFGFDFWVAQAVSYRIFKLNTKKLPKIKDFFKM
mgnify:CR=1 FL=1